MYQNSILDSHEKITDNDLKKLEQKCGFTIPEAVREHYLAYNGGYPEKELFAGEDGEIYAVNYFIPIKCKGGRTVAKVLQLLRTDEAIPNWLIPFADDEGGNLFCFSVRESDHGSIYYYDHEFEYGEDPEEHITYLAESIKVFIDSLTEDDDSEEDDMD